MAAALSVFAALALAGCTSAQDDPAPMALGEGAANTGTYPNLNIPQHGAAPQLTQQETEAKLAKLRSVQQQKSTSAPSDTAERNRKRLKILGEDQAETLKVIEEN